MPKLTIVRDGGAWSRWNAAVLMVTATLERHGLERDGSWSDTSSGLTFIGTQRECEAIAIALEGLGLHVEADGALFDA